MAEIPTPQDLQAQEASRQAAEAAERLEALNAEVEKFVVFAAEKINSGETYFKINGEQALLFKNDAGLEKLLTSFASAGWQLSYQENDWPDTSAMKHASSYTERTLDLTEMDPELRQKLEAMEDDSARAAFLVQDIKERCRQLRPPAEPSFPSSRFTSMTFENPLNPSPEEVAEEILEDVRTVTEAAEE